MPLSKTILAALFSVLIAPASGLTDGINSNVNTDLPLGAGTTSYVWLGGNQTISTGVINHVYYKEYLMTAQQFAAILFIVAIFNVKHFMLTSNHYNYKCYNYVEG